MTLKSIYNALASVETIQDLKKARLSLLDLHAAQDCFNELVKTGSTKTFINPVADFFRRCGCKVSCNDYINYTITL